MKDGPCAPCWSDDNAAGQACLPACSSCYTVDNYIKTMYGVGATKKDSATCDGITDEKTCMSSSEGSEACAWCESGAVGTSCQKQSDAESLPAAVFACEYQQAYAAYTPDAPATSTVSYRKPLTDMCNGPHESCCEAPMKDPNNCPD